MALVGFFWGFLSFPFYLHSMKPFTGLGLRLLSTVAFLELCFFSLHFQSMVSLFPSGVQTRATKQSSLRVISPKNVFSPVPYSSHLFINLTHPCICNFKALSVRDILLQPESCYPPDKFGLKSVQFLFFSLDQHPYFTTVYHNIVSSSVVEEVSFRFYI